MPRPDVQSTSRRRFLQFLAASPLLAAGAGSARRRRPAAPAQAGRIRLWAPLDPEYLFKAPKDAINVFDFEP